MSKVLKRLYLGDVVKSFGTKQLRKLTTEQPQEDTSDIIGTWVFKDTIEGLEEIGSPTNQGYAYYPDVQGVFYGTTQKSNNDGNAEDFISSFEFTSLYLWSTHFSFSSNGETRPYSNTGWSSAVGWRTSHYWQEDYNGNALDYSYSPSTLTGEALQMCKTVTFTHIGTSEKAIAFAKFVRKNATKQESIVGTWVFNDTIDLLSFPTRYTDNVGVVFESGGNKYTSMTVNYFQLSQPYYYYLMYGTGSTYHSINGWYNDVFKTIEITEEPTNETFITWLKANATKIA